MLTLLAMLTISTIWTMLTMLTMLTQARLREEAIRSDKEKEAMLSETRQQLISAQV